VRFQRRGVGTTALVGAVIVVAVVVGAIAYFVGSGTSAPGVVTSTSITTVGGSPGKTVTVTSTTSAVVTVATTSSIVSTVVTNSTKTVTSASTVITTCPGCVNDADGDGV